MSYSDSGEKKNKSNIIDIIKNDNWYEDENIVSKKLNVKNNSINNMSIRPNNYNYNNIFFNKSNRSNKNNEIKKIY